MPVLKGKVNPNHYCFTTFLSPEWQSFSSCKDNFFIQASEVA